MYKSNDYLKDQENTSQKTDDSLISEPLHPLELKYGREPKIDQEDLWSWH